MGSEQLRLGGEPPKVLRLQKPFRPVFAGTTEDNEDIIIYENAEEEGAFFLQRGNSDTIWALPPGTQVETVMEPNNVVMKLTMVSSVWSGVAHGTRWQLMEVDAR